MLTRSRRLAEGDNFSVHFDGNVGGVGGTKAPNDISNSAAPQASRKYKRKNVIIPIEEDKKAQIPVGGKAQKKVKVSGRKSPGDVPECVKSPGDVPECVKSPGDVPECVKSPGDVPECVKLLREYLDYKKSIADAEDKIENFKKSIADDIAQEGFLHNHEECLKSQEMHDIISILGLDEGNVRGVGGTKAPNDISNSAAPQASRKYKRKNVIIPIGEDKKAQISGKKVQVSGKKAPCDLPECVKLYRDYLDLKKAIADAEEIIENFKKSVADGEDLPDNYVAERLLLNDQEWLEWKSQEMNIHGMPRFG